MNTLDQKQLAAGEGSTALVRPRAAHSTSRPVNKRIDLRRWQSPVDVAESACKAAVEAVLATMEATCDPVAAEQAGREAFMANVPKLTSRLNARAYIACIDYGARGGWVDDKQLLSMVRLVTASIQSWGRTVKGKEVPA